jgi:IS30 family transposase
MAGTPLSATPEMRARWYLQVEKYGKTVKYICEIFGISRKTYYKWYNLDHHLVVRNSKRRNLRPHTKLTPKIALIVHEQITLCNYGPKKMKDYLQKNRGVTVTANAIYKYYKKKKLIRKPQKKQPWYTPLKEPYHATIPGENVQIDVKYVPGEGQTWSYQFRFIDTVTNLQYAIETQSKDAWSTIWAFQRAKQYFPFTIIGVQTDNGSEFRGVFHRYLTNKQIVHRYIPKRSAPWNGKVERANRSVDDEYYLNPMRPWKTVAQYTRWYNHERPHLGKGMNGLTPYEKYLSLVKTQKCHP